MLLLYGNRAGASIKDVRTKGGGGRHPKEDRSGQGGAGGQPNADSLLSVITDIKQNDFHHTEYTKSYT